jgi:copper transport protein
VAAAAALLLALRSRQSTRWAVLAAIAAVLAVAAPFLGHPSAVTDVRVLAMSLDAVHVLGAGGWAGGILVMSVAALPQLLRAPAAGRLDLLRSLLRAFSPLALTCAALLVATGAASAWLQLRDIGLVLGSPYGLVLFRKVIIVLMITALGAYHWRMAQPSLSSERSLGWLRTSITFDVVLVLLVLVLTAILTGTSPPLR